MNQIKRQIKQWTKQQIYENPAFTVKIDSDCEMDPLKCRCLMCNPYQHKIQMKLLATQELRSQQNKQSRLMSKFPQSHLEKVLKGLMLPNNKIVKRGVQVHIPQTCFFQDGEVASFYLTKDFDDYQMVKLKKDKITHTLMSKLFNQRRRGYREKMKRLLKMELSKREESLYKRKRQKNQKINRHQNSYAAIVRYTDGCETLISQNQLLTMLQKRKTDPFWKKIAHISNYIPQIRPQNIDPTYIDITFDSQKPVYLQLWRRANQLMQAYNGRILASHPRYISNTQQTQFCGKLSQESNAVLATYVFYKIAAFMATFADQKILSAFARMFVNEIGQCFLIQVRKLNLVPLLKYSFTNEIYDKMVHQNQENKYHRGQLQIDQQTIAKSQAINALMADQYQSLKKRYGVTVEPKEDLNQKLNNQFFAFLHPSLQGNISQLIRLDIPLTTFRRKFLGEKQERKPLFRQFNSRLVRELHQLTPNRKRPSNSSARHTQDSKSRRIPWHRRNISSFSNTINV